MANLTSLSLRFLQPLFLPPSRPLLPLHCLLLQPMAGSYSRKLWSRGYKSILFENNVERTKICPWMIWFRSTLYKNKNNLYTNETICLELMIYDQRMKLRDWIKKFLGENCSYFKRVSIKFRLWLIYSTLRSLGCISQCLEAQIALIVVHVDAYNGEKQWLQNHQIVSLSLTTCVF